MRWFSHELSRRSNAHLTVWAFVGLCAITASAYAGTPAADSQERAFMAENDQAMTTMMNGMMVKPSGDIDRDFVAMMQPHHQGAIDMAKAELLYGHNEQLRRLAQEIIVDQQQEIAAMRVALKLPLPPAVAAPTQIAPVDGMRSPSSDPPSAQPDPVKQP